MKTKNEQLLEKLIWKAGCVQAASYNVRSFRLTGEESEEMLQTIASNYIAKLDRINDRFTENCYSKTQR